MNLLQCLVEKGDRVFVGSQGLNREEDDQDVRNGACTPPNSSRAATASRSTSPSGYAIETSFSASESESSRV